MEWSIAQLIKVNSKRKKKWDENGSKALTDGAFGRLEKQENSRLESYEPTENEMKNFEHEDSERNKTARDQKHPETKRWIIKETVGQRSYKT